MKPLRMKPLWFLVSLAILTAPALVGSLPVASAQNAFYTTGTYTIDAAHSVNRNAYVGEDSSFSQTDSLGNPYNVTVNLITGGNVGNFLQVFNSSQVNLLGGTITGGLTALNDSQVNIVSGSIGTGVGTFDQSTVNITGGSFASNLGFFDSSQANITGGFFGKPLYAHNNSQVRISGGTFLQDSGVNFVDETTGDFTFLGYNLSAVNIGTDIQTGSTNYALSGFLQDGTNLRGYVLNVGQNDRFVLQNVPEPGCAALLAGACLTGVAFFSFNFLLQFSCKLDLSRARPRGTLPT